MSLPFQRHAIPCAWFGPTIRPPSSTQWRSTIHDIKYVALARSLLADQGVKQIDSAKLSTNDVRRIVRNARKASKSAERFGCEVAGRASSDGFYYAPLDYNPYHPPYLTLTERPRFIRTYYRVWGLLEHIDSDWQTLYEQFALRQLHQACEMALLPLPIGEELLRRNPSYYAIPGRRKRLHFEMKNFATIMHHRIHGGFSCSFFQTHDGNTVGRFGLASFNTLFDHSQEEFKRFMIVTPKSGSSPRVSRELILEEVRGESSDEEAYR